MIYRIPGQTIYIHGKKLLTHYVWFRRKNDPLPQRNVDPGYLVRSLVRSPNTNWWFVRNDYEKIRNLFIFFLIMSCPIVHFSGNQGEICNKFHQVRQVFSMTVAKTIRRLLKELCKKISIFFMSTAHNRQNWKRVLLSCYCHETHLV